MPARSGHEHAAGDPVRGGLGLAVPARHRGDGRLGRLDGGPRARSGAAAQAAEVKLGIAAPITGNSAAIGAQLKNGASQAVEDLNKAATLKGTTLTVTVGDDASDPKQGVSVANKFASDGVKMVVGDYNSGVSIPASDVYLDAGIIQVTPASTNVKFTERGMWNTFRTCGRDDPQ